MKRRQDVVGVEGSCRDLSWAIRELRVGIHVGVLERNPQLVGDATTTTYWWDSSWSKELGGFNSEMA